MKNCKFYAGRRGFDMIKIFKSLWIPFLSTDIFRVDGMIAEKNWEIKLSFWKMSEFPKWVIPCHFKQPCKPSSQNSIRRCVVLSFIFPINKRWMLPVHQLWQECYQGITCEKRFSSDTTLKEQNKVPESSEYIYI